MTALPPGVDPKHEARFRAILADIEAAAADIEARLGNRDSPLADPAFREERALQRLKDELARARDDLTTNVSRARVCARPDERGTALVRPRRGPSSGCVRCFATTPPEVLV